MHRSKVLVFAFIASLLPLSAFAGATGGAPNTAQPIFETGSPSGIVIQATSGYTYGYNMSGTSTTGEGVLPAPPAGYSTLGSETLGWPDLDGNGITDLVYQAPGGFTIAYLLQDDGAFVSTLDDGPIPARPAGYINLGFPDLNGDGKTDIVYQAASGFTIAYLMDGLGSTSDGPIPGLPNSNYRTLGFPDLDGDDKSDIVIQASGGYTVGYLMNGLMSTGQGQIPGLPNTNYTTIGFPNLDGGTTGDDIVIQASGGYTYAYLMDGVGTPTGQGPIPGLPNTNYTTIGFPDLDGDESDDIVIQASGGYTYAYLMNGLMTASDGPVPGLPNTNYTTIGFPNLDDTNGADIVIQASGGYTYAYLMNGTMTVSDGQIPGLPNTNYVTLPWQQDWSVFPPAP